MTISAHFFKNEILSIKYPGLHDLIPWGVSFYLKVTSDLIIHSCSTFVLYNFNWPEYRLNCLPLLSPFLSAPYMTMGLLADLKSPIFLLNHLYFWTILRYWHARYFTYCFWCISELVFFWDIQMQEYVHFAQ